MILVPEPCVTASQYCHNDITCRVFYSGVLHTRELLYLYVYWVKCRYYDFLFDVFPISVSWELSANDDRCDETSITIVRFVVRSHDMRRTSSFWLVTVIDSSWLYVTTLPFQRMTTDAQTLPLSNLPVAPLELMTGFAICIW